MTTYGYECKLDGYFERDYPIATNPSSIECPVCKDPATRSYSVPAISFKGSGFYSTDKNKGRNA